MLTGITREDVLAWLYKLFLVAELPDDEDGRRRESRRRSAISTVLEDSGVVLSSQEVTTIWK